jgi:hypothetical protein
MLLTTRHPIDFDITKDVVDINKSHILDEYFDNDKTFTNAYKWLFNLIGVGPYIWNYAKNSHLVRRHGEEYQEWTLDVPRSECIIINEDIWGMVLNKMPHFDMPSDISDKEYSRLYDMYKPIKEKTWEDNIFKVKEDSIENMQILIKSPVLEKYVIDKKWICELNYEEFDIGITNTVFSSQEKADHYAEVIESGLKARKLPYKKEFKKSNFGFGVKIEWEPNKV